MHESVFEKIKRENILGYWNKDDLIYCNDHNMKFVVLTEIDLFDGEPFPKLTI